MNIFSRHNKAKPASIEKMRRLAQRFDDGATTPAEERSLFSFFRTHGSLPPDLEEMREMFEWYDSLHTQNAKEPPMGHRRVTWWQLAQIAAIVAIVFLTGIIAVTSKTELDEARAEYAGSCIVIDGKLHDPSEVSLLTIKLAEVNNRRKIEEIDRHLSLVAASFFQTQQNQPQ